MRVVSRLSKNKHIQTIGEFGDGYDHNALGKNGNWLASGDLIEGNNNYFAMDKSGNLYADVFDEEEYFIPGFDHSIDINGNGYVNLGETGRNGSTVGGLTAFTVMSWVYQYDSSGIQRLWNFPKKGQSGTEIIFENGQITSIKISSDDESTLHYTNGSSISENKWTHIAVSWNGSNDIKIFVDGVDSTNDFTVQNEGSPSNNHTGDSSGFTTAINSERYVTSPSIQSVEGEPDNVSKNSTVSSGNFNTEKNNKIETIGCDYVNNSEFWKGMINYFSQWSVALTNEEVNKYMYELPNGDESNLIGYWPLTDGYETIAQDISTNKNDGHVKGNTKWRMYVNRICLEFDGQDDQLVTSNELQIGTSKWTVESWYYARKTDNYGHIFTSQSSQDNFACKVSTPTLEPYFHSSNISTYEGGVPLEKHTWYHLAYTYDGSTIRVYVNGEITAEKDVDTSLDIPSDKFVVQSGGSTVEYVNAFHNDLRLWIGIAKSSAQIKESMKTSLIGNENNLELYWPMDEGQGKQVQDRTSNNNHGIFNGNPTWALV